MGKKTMTTFYFVCFLTLFWVQFSHQDEGQGNFTDLYQKLERLEMKVTNQNVIIENQNVLIQQLTTKPPSDTPFNYNIAKNKAINASATCGDGHVDTWCKLAEYNISRINSMYKECNFCTATNPEGIIQPIMPMTMMNQHGGNRLPFQEAWNTIKS